MEWLLKELFSVNGIYALGWIFFIYTALRLLKEMETGKQLSEKVIISTSKITDSLSSSTIEHRKETNKNTDKLAVLIASVHNLHTIIDERLPKGK